MVEFASNGGTAAGYLATPEGGSGPGVIVVQEWWGLDSGITEMADRLAAAGFVALAPDLYHGELAGHTEMDKAGELMQSMPPDRAGRDMSGAVDYLADHDATTGDGIGVMGFSAGGNLAVLASTAFNARAYAPIDAIDRVSPRPDFAIPVYPGHMTMEHKNKTPKAIAAQELNTDIVVSPDVPPTLLIHARDDTVDPVHYSLVYARELKKAGVDVDLMLYDTGGHAFGVRKQGKDTDRWPEDAVRWLRRIGVL